MPAIGRQAAKSASSQMMWVDLPPSSNSVFFTVGAGGQDRPAGRRRSGERDHVDPGSADSAAPTSLALRR